MKEKLRPYFENSTEAGLACLVTMVQGDFISLTAAHWFIATQTGLIAGVVTATAVVLARIRKPWVISVVLGGITAVVDYFVHPGMLSRFAIVEALITGIGAALLSLAVAKLIEFTRKGRSGNATT